MSTEAIFHGPVGYNSCVGNLDGESSDGGVGEHGGCDHHGNDVYDGGVAYYDGYGDDGGSAHSTRQPRKVRLCQQQRRHQQQHDGDTHDDRGAG